MVRIPGVDKAPSASGRRGLWTGRRHFRFFSIVQVPQVCRAEYGTTLESRPARCRAAWKPFAIVVRCPLLDREDGKIQQAMFPLLFFFQFEVRLQSSPQRRVPLLPVAAPRGTAL